MHATLPLLEATDFPVLHRGALEILQVNLGYRCNQTCLHCHVNAGPRRTEMMGDEDLSLVVKALQARAIYTLDLTGGAPEMHPRFRWLVEQARQLDIRVIDRCNLTILSEPGYESTAEFLAHRGVEVVASLPCYSVKNVDKQRGDGVFDRSIDALIRLNALGYGQPGSGLVLNLVYNPPGPQLPPSQQQLEADYKRELKQRYNITFNSLFTLANMPIQRFGSTLISKGTFDEYMQLLKSNYQAANLEGLMCKNTISVDWLGYLYDCDFNQQLGVPVMGRRHLRDLLADDLAQQQICIADHCYGCTAGQGSSCGGALA